MDANAERASRYIAYGWDNDVGTSTECLVEATLLDDGTIHFSVVWLGDPAAALSKPDR